MYLIWSTFKNNIYLRLYLREIKSYLCLGPRVSFVQCQAIDMVFEYAKSGWEQTFLTLVTLTTASLLSGINVIATQSSYL